MWSVKIEKLHTHPRRTSTRRVLRKEYISACVHCAVCTYASLVKDLFHVYTFHIIANDTSWRSFDGCRS